MKRVLLGKNKLLKRVFLGKNKLRMIGKQVLRKYLDPKIITITFILASSLPFNDCVSSTHNSL
jgi:hypothetical protein